MLVNCPQCHRAISLPQDGPTNSAPCPVCSSTLSAGARPIPGEGPPRRAGRYLVEELIAEGGMGAVLRVRDPSFGRTLAVKVMLPALAEYPEARERFLEEAQITGRLQHPGIPPVHELGQLDDGLPFFAMKLIQGQTLSALLEDRGLRFADREQTTVDPRLIVVFRQVCQTLAYAHERGIIHRDLKPSNIMIGAFGEVQVMDWGLAKELLPASGLRSAATQPEMLLVDAAVNPPPRISPRRSSQTEAGMVIGTPGYMAPEQARGEVGSLDQRCDVFGLGAILCQMLTGQQPFCQEVTAELLEETAAGDLRTAYKQLERCGADAELIELAQRCLAPDPEDRPRDAREVAAAVERYEAQAQQRWHRAELERAQAQVRAEQEHQRAEVEQARADEEARRRLAEQGKAAAERRRRQATMAWAATALLVTAGAAGIALWHQQERAAQDAREAARDADDLRQLAQQQRRHELREQDIATSLRRARDVLDQLDGDLGQGGGVFKLLDHPTDWQHRLELAATALKHAGNLKAGSAGPVAAALLEELRDLDRRLRSAGADRTLALQLEEVRLDAARIVEGRLQIVSAARAYHRVFAKAGLPAPEAEGAALAQQVRRSAIREQLLAALDNWALAAWHGGHADQARCLLEVARQGDPDPGRNELRELQLWLDPQAVTQRAAALAGTEKGRGPSRRLAPQRWFLVSRLLPDQDRAPWLRQGQAEYPEDFWLNLELANELARTNPVEASGFYRVALVLRPHSSVARFNLGTVLHGRGDLDGARRQFQRALQDSPDSAEAHNNLGLVLYAQHKRDDAVRHLTRALELNPRLALAHTNLGKILYDEGNLEGAYRHLLQALALDPDHAQTHNNLGLVLKDRHDLAGAVRHYQKALHASPQMVAAHVNMGIALLEQGDADGACRAFTCAIEIDPGFARAHENLAFVLSRKKDLAGAARHYRKALELAPRCVEAHNGLGVVLRDQQDLEGAVEHFKQALHLDPRYVPAHVNLGLILHQQKDPDAALRYLRQAVALHPSLVPAHTNLGVILADRQDWEGAARSFRAALQLAPDDARVQCFLGKVLREQGQFAEALKHFQLGHELGSRQPDWSYPSGQWRQECMQLLHGDQKVQAILRGQIRPANPQEALALAVFCRRFKRPPAAAARLYAEAFAARPALAEDQGRDDRYQAACSAALAAGPAAGTLPEQERQEWRRQALGWLRADLQRFAGTIAADRDSSRAAKPQSASVLAKLAAQVPRPGPTVLRAVADRLRCWLTEPDLASVREEPALARLAAQEQRDWRQFWVEVRALQDQVQADADKARQ